MHSGKTLAQALAETSAAALIAKCDHADQAARVITAVLAEATSPKDASSPLFCQIREHVLLVSACSVAQAAKLRQALPRLLAAVQERGLNLSEIRIRVQPGPSAEPNSGGTPPSGAGRDDPSFRPAVGGALLMADELARTLRPSELRQAAERLARMLRTRF